MKETIQNPVSVPEKPDDTVSLCRLAADGDPDSQRRLMELLFNRIHRTISYLAGHREDAQDIAQNACIEVLVSAGSFRGDSSLEYWADRVTLQTAAKIFEKRKRRQRIGAAGGLPPVEGTLVDDDVHRDRIRRRLSVLLSRIKIEQRKALVLRYVYGYSIKEVAGLCDAPVETAKSRLKLGRKKLRKAVTEDAVMSEWIKGWLS